MLFGNVVTTTNNPASALSELCPIMHIMSGHVSRERLEPRERTLLSEPRETPWKSLNSRLDSPDGPQITIFEELEGAHERAQLPGFGTANQR